MAEITTIARPYAEAAFKLALEGQTVPLWSDMLQWMAAVAADPDMAALVGNPKVDRAQLVAIFSSVCAGKLNQEAETMVRVLVENHRLPALPAIHLQFEALRHQQEGVLDARIATAFSLSAQELEALVAGLEKRFGRKIRPEVVVDTKLIGGIKITVGDVVIDGSVRARIDQMAIALKR